MGCVTVRRAGTTDLNGGTRRAAGLQLVLPPNICQVLLLVEQFVVLVDIKGQRAAGRANCHSGQTTWAEHQR